MLEFIRLNMLDIGIIIVFIVIIAILYKKGKKEIVKELVLGLVVQAEKSLGGGTGDLKYATVVSGVYKYLPTVLKILFTTKDIDNLIEDGVNRLKEINK